MILIGLCQVSRRQKTVEVHGKEKRSLKIFLGVQNSKIVELGKVIGIGGEGIVIEKELEIEVMQGTAEDQYSEKPENIQLKSKERIITAMKFVKFASDARRVDEDFQGRGFPSNQGYSCKI